MADALRKNCGATNGCSCADQNYQWYGPHCEASMTSVFREMLKGALPRPSPLPSSGEVWRKALEDCLGCVTAAEAEGLHEIIAELRGRDELTDSLIDRVERRLLWVRNYAEPVLASPAETAGERGAAQGLLPYLTDRELYDNSCITRNQLKNWVDSDYARHIAGLKHTIEFLLARLDAASSLPSAELGTEA